MTENVKQKVHLATGIRTEQCMDMLTYMTNLQSRNKLLYDAVEFFEQQMNTLKELEQEKEERQSVINTLMKEKD